MSLPFWVDTNMLFELNALLSIVTLMDTWCFTIWLLWTVAMDMDGQDLEDSGLNSG